MVPDLDFTLAAELRSKRRLRVLLALVAAAIVRTIAAMVWSAPSPLPAEDEVAPTSTGRPGDTATLRPDEHRE